MFIYKIVSILALITADMEYFNVVANYMGRLTFIWSGKFSNSSVESQGKLRNFYNQTEWEPC